MSQAAVADSILFVRFGQLAWDCPLADILAVHARFGWEHPMDGDYLTTGPR